MGNADKHHFDSYRYQTKVKHRMLELYLPAYFGILRTGNSNLVYFDAFAGSGTYSDELGEFDGSPIRALKLIAENEKLSKAVQCVFSESLEQHYEQLEASVRDFWEQHSHIKEPMLEHGAFQSLAKRVLDDIDSKNGTLAPTFLFVDPCGVSGVDLNIITNILARKYCEVFMFFNLEAIRRITGLALKSGDSETLNQLLGSESRAAKLIKAFGGTSDVAEREAMILAAFREALIDGSGAKFVIPLRIEREDRRTTSHYLIHATKYPLGFKIMKGIIWNNCDNVDEEGGRLAMLQRSAGAACRLPGLIFPDDSATPASRLLVALAGKAAIKVGDLIDSFVLQPNDMLAEHHYKNALKQLEEDGSIQVLDKNGIDLMPASKRRRRKGKTTLGDGHFVKLA